GAAVRERGHSVALAAPAPRALVDALRAKQIPIQVGHSVIEADATFASEFLAVIRRLEQPYVLIFNRGRMMALPTGVNKATGFREALRTLRLSPHNAIAIGDAENDHDLLDASEFAVAVAWVS